MASYIGTEHYGFTFTVQEGLDAVSDVIYHLETYDITTIRAGTPMFLLSRKVLLKILRSDQPVVYDFSRQTTYDFSFLHRE